MKRFRSWLTEQKNLHQLHLEQLSFSGVSELRRAISILSDLRDQLYHSEGSEKNYNVSQKWDGAPAIFFGINPENGKFFISGKALFKKNPRLMYSTEDIDNDQWYGKMEGLKPKLKASFKFLKPLVTKGIYQGDLMFTKGDIKTEKINGQSHITFKPNTITYTVEKDSDLAKRMLKAELGIVVHTRYDGSTLETLQQNFNIDISIIKKSPKVWMSDAYLPSYAGVLNFTKVEYDTVTALLSRIGTIFKKTSKGAFESVNGTELGQRMETTVNQFIRNGKMIDNLKIYWKQFEEYVKEVSQKEEDRFKTDVKKESVRARYKVLWDNYKKYKKELGLVLEIYKLVAQAKMVFVRKFEEIEGNVHTFIQTSKGFQSTKPEGFCAVSSNGSLITKLVDRLEFSANNFNVAKTW
jgi:hypothetical protein